MVKWNSSPNVDYGHVMNREMHGLVRINKSNKVTINPDLCMEYETFMTI